MSKRSRKAHPAPPPIAPPAQPEFPPLLPAMLQLAVPIEIYKLHQRGGPHGLDWDRARDFADRLGCNGDALLYRVDSAKAREEGRDTTSMFAGLVRALAVLAHVPGGVRVAGVHFNVSGEWAGYP